jgi:hypothetical protein
MSYTLYVDDAHGERLFKMLGFKPDEFVHQEEMEQAIDNLYTRLYPSLQDEQVQQEMDDHNADRNC